MFTEKDWLKKQEQINEQLRRRAEERAHPLRDERPRRAQAHVRALAPRKVLRRTFASAARLLPLGG